MRHELFRLRRSAVLHPAAAKAVRSSSAVPRSTNRLAEHRSIRAPGGIAIGQADGLGAHSGDTARMKRSHVQLLPRRKVAADDDNDLGVEAHGKPFSRRRRRVLFARAAVKREMDRNWFHLARDPALGIEGLQAKLDTYAYGRHAHETYAIGVCEAGSQTFTCRRRRHRTRPGSVILFEPFEQHDGHATTGAAPA